MSRKYIKELLSYDFVYPNNNVPEYDLEIVHDINNNSVSGTVSSFTGLLTSATGITVSMTGTWNLNGAEPYINQSGDYTIFSVHMMDKTQNYYRPWSLVFHKEVATGTTTYNYNETFTVTPSMVGVTGFTAGTYYFEVRMIGHRAVYPICVTIPISSTPVTPTPTHTSTPTPTPTPTSTGCTTPNVCMAITVTGATGPEVYAGTISYNNCYGVLVNENFTTQGTRYRCIQYISGVAQIFSYTGIETPTIYGGNCNSFSCPGGVVPLPTATPTPTPTGTSGSVTPTPTPTPTGTNTPTPTPTGTNNPTPTPTSTPLSTQNIQVRECGTSSPTYGITINVTGLIVGLAEKMNGGSGVLNGKCWEIINANYTGTIDYTATHVSTSLSCASCTPDLTPTPTPTSSPTPTPSISYELYTADRYTCDSPSGPCTYVETIQIANPVVMVGGKFYYDNINGYILNVAGTGTGGPYLYTDCSGLGTNNCSSLCGL